jgi:hypothetical protein
MMARFGAISFVVVCVGLVTSIAYHQNHPETWDRWDCNPAVYWPALGVLLLSFVWLFWECRRLVRTQARAAALDELIAQARERLRKRDDEKQGGGPC